MSKKYVSKCLASRDANELMEEMVKGNITAKEYVEYLTKIPLDFSLGFGMSFNNVSELVNKLVKEEPKILYYLNRMDIVGLNNPEDYFKDYGDAFVNYLDNSQVKFKVTDFRNLEDLETLMLSIRKSSTVKFNFIPEIKFEKLSGEEMLKHADWYDLIAISDNYLDKDIVRAIDLNQLANNSRSLKLLSQVNSNFSKEDAIWFHNEISKYKENRYYVDDYYYDLLKDDLPDVIEKDDSIQFFDSI